MESMQGVYQAATVMVIDDTPDNLMLIVELLKDRYRVKAANSGEKALRLLQGNPLPDLILLDIMMQGLSGYDVAEQLKLDIRTRHIPIVFLTSMATTQDEIRGLSLGAADYITKPIIPPVLMARVATQIKVKAAADFLLDKNEILEQEVQRRTREVTAIQDVTIHAMASLAKTRDYETGNHIRRTQHYIKLLAELLREHPRFHHFLDEETIKQLFKSAPLHDIGKIGIPDRILLKPGRLTLEEFEIMQTHTSLGRDAIQHSEDQLGMGVNFLHLAKEIAYSHHEKWDGSGYPQGLASDDIPISARLMALVDVYDALISRRVYKPGIPHVQAVEIIREGSGSHFDPDICDAFLANVEHFREVAVRFADNDQDVLEHLAE